jgi:hypothetical protein
MFRRAKCCLTTSPPNVSRRSVCRHWQQDIPRRGWPLTVCRHQSGDGRNGQKLGGRTCASRHYRQCGGTRRDANPDAERTGRETSPPICPPIGRLIAPEEVAALVSFLLSEEAAAITGQEMVICGGASLS